MPAPKLSPNARSATIWALYIVGLAPGVFGFYQGATGQIPGDPVRIFEHMLGLWALRFLCLGLAVTPLRDLAGINLIAFRRALGLIAFYYVLAHFTVYLTLDRGMMFNTILADILKRPYITLGMAGLLMLIPLALTSNRWSIRKLGSNWSTLHKLVYPILIVAVLHYSLSLKVVTAEPAFYILVSTLLLGYRIFRPRLMAAKRERKGRATAQ